MPVSAPSSRTAEETVKAAYDAFGKGDVAAVVGAFDANIVWNAAESHPYADRNPYRGPDGVLNGLFARIAEEWEDFLVAPKQFTSAGNRVVAEGRYTGKYKGTGSRIDMQFAHVWTVEGGRITAFQQYTDTAQLLHATGKGAGMAPREPSTPSRSSR
jgi:ketosteroid isomerase-like protein